MIIKAFCYTLICIILFLGVIFASLLTHEYTHVLQSKEPISLCYDYQQNTYAHVSHNSSYYNTTEWEVFYTYTEKCASIIERGTGYILTCLISVIITLHLKK